MFKGCHDGETVRANLAALATLPVVPPSSSSVYQTESAAGAMRRPVDGQSCDSCKYRGAWKAGYSRGGGRGYAYSECMHDPIPAWWAERGERPIIMPGAGTHCPWYENGPRPTASGNDADARYDEKKDRALPVGDVEPRSSLSNSTESESEAVQRPVGE